NRRDPKPEHTTANGTNETTHDKKRKRALAGRLRQELCSRRICASRKAVGANEPGDSQQLDPAAHELVSLVKTAPSPASPAFVSGRGRLRRAGRRTATWPAPAQKSASPRRRRPATCPFPNARARRAPLPGRKPVGS